MMMMMKNMKYSRWVGEDMKKNMKYSRRVCNDDDEEHEVLTMGW